MKARSHRKAPSGITRREFTKAVGAGLAAVSLAGPRVHAQDKSGTHPLVFGKGEHTYELIPDWARLPKGKQFGNTHGVVEDAQGRIFIHNASPTGDAVCIFDADGKFIDSWGVEFQRGAHGMTLHQEGNEEFLYLACTNQNRIYKTTLSGEIVWSKGPPPLKEVYGQRGRYVPTNIAFAPNGDFYVADGYGQSWIHHYGPTGEYIRSWGGKGKEPGKMDCPHGIWVDTRGSEPTVVVADRANVRLQYFTLDGKHIRFVAHDLRYPCNFRIRGSDLLIPDLYGRVTIFDKDNQLITHLGLGSDDAQWKKPEGYPNVPHEKRVVGEFISPHDACWDAKGNLYVVEWVPDGRVTKLRRV
ncbi:MAG: hypothetical protein HRF43_03445 [Phycisphaerae bacterium]|jgi:hypothetical protein